MSSLPNPDPIATARLHLAAFVRTLRAHRIIIRLPFISAFPFQSGILSYPEGLPASLSE